MFRGIGSPKAGKRYEKDKIRKELNEDVQAYLEAGGTIKVFDNGEQVAEKSLKTFDRQFIHK